MAEFVRFLYFRYAEQGPEFEEFIGQDVDIQSIHVPPNAIGFCVAGDAMDERRNYYLIDEKVTVMPIEKYIKEFTDIGQTIGRIKESCNKAGYFSVLMGAKSYDVIRLTEHDALLDRETRQPVPHLA